MKTPNSDIAAAVNDEESHVCMAEGTKLLFDATLYPHRSLKPHQFRRLFWFLVAVCLFAGLRFIVVGAWPVVYWRVYL